MQDPTDRSLTVAARQKFQTVHQQNQQQSPGTIYTAQASDYHAGMWHHKIFLLMLALLTGPVSTALAQSTNAPKASRWIGIILAVFFVIGGGVASAINPRRSQRD